MKIFYIFLIIVVLGCSCIALYFPTNMFDVNIITMFQTLQTHVLTLSAQLLANLGGLPGTSLLLFILGLYWLYKKQFYPIILCAFGLFLTTLTAWSLKWLVDRPRPFMEMDFVPAVKTYGSSFPSGHSAYGMMLACMLLMTFYEKNVRASDQWSADSQPRAWLWYVACIWVILMGFSRIYLGVHYITDVLAGWSLAFIVMVTVRQVLQHFEIHKRYF